MIIYILIAVEQIIIVNCLKCKIKLWKIIVTLLAITIALSLLAIFCFSNVEGFGDGSGRFLVLGVLYLVPGFLFYKDNKLQKFIIHFAAFTYGIGVFSISFRIAYIFSERFFYLSAFLAQLIINLILLPKVLKYSKSNLVPMLNSLTNKVRKTLLQSCIVSFFLVILINSAITRDTSPFQKAITVLLLFYFILISYKLMVDYNNETKRSDVLLDLATTNKVTEMSNGIQFQLDANILINNEIEFTIIYIDLDQFKRINDNFGHIKGDEYLFEFGKVLKDLEKNNNIKSYHLSGDEFCLVIKKSVDYSFKIMEPIKIEKLADMKFLGFSYGLASYPKDGKIIKDVLANADFNMYQIKSAKHYKR